MKTIAMLNAKGGVGKTTLASIIARQTNRALRKLNGTTAGTADPCRQWFSALSGPLMGKP